jgi:hypothetical protein
MASDPRHNYYNSDMTRQEIQRLRATQPFEPFRVLVADGRQYDVRHPENFAIAGNGRLIAIGMPDHFVTLDLFLVTGIQRPISQKRSGTRRRVS